MNYVLTPMVKIRKLPILLHIIKYYSTFGFKNFVLCGGYKIINYLVLKKIFARKIFFPTSNVNFFKKRFV